MVGHKDFIMASKGVTATNSGSATASGAGVALVCFCDLLTRAKKHA
jgi:hypothetical protein